MLSELRERLENIDAAILTLERLQFDGRRRGRPPKILADLRNRVRDLNATPRRPTPAG